MDWFAAADGLASGAGTINSPWDLDSALLNTTQIRAGDTLYLRGGTYELQPRTPDAAFLVSLAGEAGNPIEIRPYHNERVTLDGGIKGEALPKHLLIRDLEVLISENVGQPRTVIYGTSYRELNRPYGGIEFTDGQDIRLVNNVVHDCARGVHIWGKVQGSDCYGNVIYGNGWLATDRGHGHGIYTQNEGPLWRRIGQNIIFNNWGANVHAYGSSRAAIERISLAANILFETKKQFDGRALVGGLNESSNRQIEVMDNVSYGVNLQIGYGGVPVTDALIVSNTVVMAKIEAEHLVNSQVADNFVWEEERTSNGYTGRLKPAPEDGAEIPTEPVVLLRPNLYDLSRADLAVLDFQSRTHVDVDLAMFLMSGDGYELLNPADLYGLPVLEGRYSGVPVSIPTAGAPFAAYILRRKQVSRKRITITVDCPADLKIIDVRLDADASGA